MAACKRLCGTSGIPNGKGSIAIDGLGCKTDPSGGSSTVEVSVANAEAHSIPFDCSIGIALDCRRTLSSWCTRSFHLSYDSLGLVARRSLVASLRCCIPLTGSRRRSMRGCRSSPPPCVNIASRRSRSAALEAIAAGSCRSTCSSLVSLLLESRFRGLRRAAATKPSLAWATRKIDE